MKLIMIRCADRYQCAIQSTNQFGNPSETQSVYLYISLHGLKPPAGVFSHKALHGVWGQTNLFRVNLIYLVLNP